MTKVDIAVGKSAYVIITNLSSNRIQGNKLERQIHILSSMSYPSTLTNDNRLLDVSFFIGKDFCLVLIDVNQIFASCITLSFI
jgi:hypothetical protein